MTFILGHITDILPNQIKWSLLAIFWKNIETWKLFSQHTAVFFLANVTFRKICLQLNENSYQTKKPKPTKKLKSDVALVIVNSSYS